MPDFTPSVYEHAAALIGRTPFQVSRSSDLLFRAFTEAYRLYNHSPVIVGIDIYNLEAEAYGAVLNIPEGNGISAVAEHPVSKTVEIKLLHPVNPDADGRLPMVIETGRRLAIELPGADVRIPVSGPFSLAGNLVGFERLLLDLLENPASVTEALFWLATGQISFCRKIIENGLGIAFFESGATPPLISPELFSQTELPVLKFMIGAVSNLAGYAVPCIIGGNTAPVIREIMSTGAGYVICPSETNQALFMEEMKHWPESMVRINMRPDVFTTNDTGKLYHELERVLALAAARDRVCVGTGVLPYESKPEMVILAKEYLGSIGRQPEEIP